MGAFTFFGVDDPFDPQCTLVTSNILSVYALGFFRLAIAIYTLVVLIFSLVWEGVVLHDVSTFFSYFTHLSYIGLCAYFWASSVQTLSYASRLGARSKTYHTVPGAGQTNYPLQHWPRFLQLAHVLLLITVYVAPFIVTIVFWWLLSSGAFDNAYDIWENLSVHAANSVFAILEILFSRCILPWSGIPIIVAVCGSYIGLAYVTRATQGIYVYNFLNPAIEGDKVAAYVFGILIVSIIILGLVKGICWARDKTLGRYRSARTGAVMEEDLDARGDKSVHV